MKSQAKKVRSARSGGQHEFLSPTMNVRAVLKDQNGRIHDVREVHNVFTNNGRQWLRNHIARAAYPVTYGQQTNCSSASDGTYDEYSSVIAGAVGKSYWPRYIGVGVGGVGQSITPPGPGTYTEVVTVTKLERPVMVTDVGSDQWLKQLLPQNDFSETETFPTSYSIRYRAIFGPDDLSFAGQPSYATAVPVSEFALFTSEAGRDVDPQVGDNGTIGCIAYTTIAPIVKTPKFILELGWELRF